MSGRLCVRLHAYMPYLCIAEVSVRLMKQTLAWLLARRIPICPLDILQCGGWYLQRCVAVVAWLALVAAGGTLVAAGGTVCATISSSWMQPFRRDLLGFVLPLLSLYVQLAPATVRGVQMQALYSACRQVIVGVMDQLQLVRISCIVG